MNFDFSPDQKALRDQARKFLAEHASSVRVRRILDTDEPYDRELWRGVAEMGWTGTAIPETYGGAGFGHLELCVIAEELGRSVAPIPFSSTVYLAAEALMLAGSEAQKRRWLPRIASGEAIGCLALSEGAGTPAPPYASGMVVPVQPISATPRQSSRSYGSSVSRMRRTRTEEACSARNFRAWSRSAF